MENVCLDCILDTILPNLTQRDAVFDRTSRLVITVSTRWQTKCNLGCVFKEDKSNSSSKCQACNKMQAQEVRVNINSKLIKYDPTKKTEDVRRQMNYQ